MEIAHVAGQMESRQLALAVAHLVEPGGDALRYQAGIVHMLSRYDDVRPAPELSHPAVETQDRPLLIQGQRRSAQKPR